MNSKELRRRFLDYFKKNGHMIIPSSPVVPHDDPTLLFNNAGMNQFKDLFLGKSRQSYSRAATAQKCIRVGGKHNDLDNVGHTTRHLTFFEMLGNFSFGDYFKEDAIRFAFEMATIVLEFPIDKLFISVFEKDDEAFDLWLKYLPATRIVRIGEKDNFWMMGDTGPCGPCSELFIDRGSKYGTAKSPKEDVDGERFLEFWNLVFMQYNRTTAGQLEELPRPSIDTGMGLERAVALKMGVESVFETDILRSLIESTEEIVGKKYLNYDPAFHVIADHIRSLSFAIADGAQPSNTDRGYVLRKLIRRAVRYGHQLGMQRPFLAELLPRLVSEMGDDFPELVTAQGRITEIVTLEEESFIRTLKRGGHLLKEIIDQAQKSSAKQIEGEAAFKLKDTYGLPLEEIMLLAKDSHLSVNIEAYQLLEQEAREKSRASKQSHQQVVEESHFAEFINSHPPCRFIGYDKMQMTALVTALLVDGKFVQEIRAGEKGMIVLDQTPFYAEKGGQIGDSGILSHQEGSFQVQDCKTPYPGVIAHIGICQKGFFQVGQTLYAEVDVEKRNAITNNHTATHLLHFALQEIVGKQIRQAGSLVDALHLRFDFNHHKALTNNEIRTVELLVNTLIRRDDPVETFELSLEEAQKQPDIKQFFGDKYGSHVRVVSAGGSKELCGGTHTKKTGSICFFRITKESSVAAGVRRIEAVTRKEAELFCYTHDDLIEKGANILKTTPAQLLSRAAAVIEENRTLLQTIKQLKGIALKRLAQEIVQQHEVIGATPLITALVDVPSDELPELADSLMQKMQSCVIILAQSIDGNCRLLIRVSQDLIKKGVQASSLIREIAPLIGGSGGGKADSAQAGGKEPSQIPQAFEKARDLLTKHVTRT